jgi:hypothetical protein
VKLRAGKILIPGVSHATDCRLAGRVHPQIAWAKLRDGATIASKKLCS